MLLHCMHVTLQVIRCLLKNNINYALVSLHCIQELICSVVQWRDVTYVHCIAYKNWLIPFCIEEITCCCTAMHTITNLIPLCTLQITHLLLNCIAFHNATCALKNNKLCTCFIALYKKTYSVVRWRDNTKHVLHTYLNCKISMQYMLCIE